MNMVIFLSHINKTGPEVKLSQKYMTHAPLSFKEAYIVLEEEIRAWASAFHSANEFNVVMTFAMYLFAFKCIFSHFNQLVVDIIPI